MTLEILCQVCGKSLSLEWNPTGFANIDKTTRKLAEQTVHDHCFEGKAMLASKASEMERITAKGSSWNLLCPPLYQNSEEWLSGPDSKRVNRRAIESALAWQYGPSGLVMHGKGSGTGKTTSAWVLCKREFFASKFIVALSHVELTAKATWASCANNKESAQWVRVVKTCDLLFVDDLGKSRFKTVDGQGKVAEEFFFDLLDYRITHRLPIIFTANITGKELKESMSVERGSYFTRRIKEHFQSICFDSNELAM